MGNERAQEAHDLWNSVCGPLSAQVNEAAWRTWFEGVRPHELRDDILVLTVPSRLVRDRISASYGEAIRALLRDVSGQDLGFDLVVHTEPAEPAEPRGPAEPLPAPPVLAPARFSTTEPSPGLTDEDTLNPRYRFEDFVIGASNRFAHAAALSVAEAPARSYNPLFIYGQAGLGKTHLLHAVGHYIRQVFPSMRVRYVTTERMMNEYVLAIQTTRMPEFQRRNREVDLLLVDDIQFLEKSERLQEEFFHTFNSLHTAHRQIVITSDRPPKALATLEERLRSRFEWGLITDVQPPEFETRLAILQKKREAEDFHHVPDEVLGFIATHVKDNVRFLEGALIRVAAYGRLNNTPLSETVAREVLADLLPSAEPRAITPPLILDETAKMFGWTVDELVGKSRTRPLVRARQIGMYVFRELTDFSYPQIAREFGGRDHTTVMHAVEKISSLIAEQRAVFEQVTELISRIRHGERA